MGIVSNHANLQWLLSLNPSLVQVLNSRYAQNQGLFPYVDGLIGYLRGRVQFLREKAAEVGNPQDFDSFVSELRFAVALCSRGKTVRMIPTSSWTVAGQVPDFICDDGGLEIFFEAKRATEGEGTVKLTRFLQNYLRPQAYEVTVTVKPKWTSPTNNPRSRPKRRRLADDSIQRFTSLFPRPMIKTRYATYLTRSISSSPGYASIQTAYSGDIGLKKYMRDASEKAAEKRRSWVARYANTPYIAAIENEEPGAADDITIRETFYGSNGRGGAFRQDPKLRNLSGVLTKNGSTFYYLRNRYSDTRINPQSFNRFLPLSFRVRWRGPVGRYL